VKKDVYKDAHLVVDYLELMEFHDHSHHRMSLTHMEFQIPIYAYQGPSTNQDEFPIGVCP
jgi:hypothetical protein